MQYRKTQQNIEAIRRQMEANPEAFRQMQEEQLRAGSAASASRKDDTAAGKEPEESKEPAAAAEGGDAEGDADGDARSQAAFEEQVKQKREAIDKQQAFIEYKQTNEGQTYEGSIRDRRNLIREKRAEIKNLTDQLNVKKGEIDELKDRLDRKEEERKMRMRDEQMRSEDMFEDQAEEIIDEEELVMLRQMKDLKKAYREQFHDLTLAKTSCSDF